MSVEQIAEEIENKNKCAHGREPTSGTQRRRRKRSGRSGEVWIERRAADGSLQALSGKLVDFTADGVGVEASSPLEINAWVTIATPLFQAEAGAGKSRRARVVHCATQEGTYRIGFCFDGSSNGAADPNETVWKSDSPFIDYYDVLQISANADPEMIQRVYRLLAQRYHPDNTESGNSETFRLILQAYRVLSDPEKRAAYDVKYHSARSVRWKIFHRPQDAEGFEEDKRIRWGVLSALYAIRKQQPQRPGLTIKEIEDLLGCPREHLEFSLWYLRGKSHVQIADQGRFVITPEGVDAAEEIKPLSARPTRALLEGARTGERSS